MNPERDVNVADKMYWQKEKIYRFLQLKRIVFVRVKQMFIIKMIIPSTVFGLQRSSRDFNFLVKIYFLQILTRSLICKADKSAAVAVTVELGVLELG